MQPNRIQCHCECIQIQVNSSSLLIAAKSMDDSSNLCQLLQILICSRSCNNNYRSIMFNLACRSGFEICWTWEQNLGKKSENHRCWNVSVEFCANRLSRFERGWTRNAKNRFSKQCRIKPDIDGFLHHELQFTTAMDAAVAEWKVK